MNGKPETMNSTPPPSPSPAPPPGTRRWRAWPVVAVVALLATVGAWLGTSRTSDRSDVAVVSEATTVKPPISVEVDRARTLPTLKPSLETSRLGNVYTFSSSPSYNDIVTGAFSIDDDWSIHWDVSSGEMTISIRDAAGALVDSFPVGEGQGESAYPKGGAHSLEITSTGSEYTIRVSDHI